MRIGTGDQQVVVEVVAEDFDTDTSCYGPAPKALPADRDTRHRERQHRVSSRER